MLGTSVKVKLYRDTTSFHRRSQCGGSAAKMASCFCTGPNHAGPRRSALEAPLEVAMFNTGTHLLLTMMLVLGLAFPGCSSEEESVTDGDAVDDADLDAVSCDDGASCDTAETAIPEDTRPQPMECDAPAPPLSDSESMVRT